MVLFVVDGDVDVVVVEVGEFVGGGYVYVDVGMCMMEVVEVWY